jgi:hypothetical protein
MKNKIRINNIEFRKTTNTNVKKTSYQIVKYQNNPYYNKEQEYLNRGYIETSDGYYLTDGIRSISKLIFNTEETCYVIAFIERDSESWYLKTIGNRLLELNNDELNDFMQVYRNGNKKLK